MEQRPRQQVDIPELHEHTYLSNQHLDVCLTLVVLNTCTDISKCPQYYQKNC
jgi:hypothetical protein